METKTTAIIGIVFIVLVIGGALALSYTGIATVGKFTGEARAVPVSDIEHIKIKQYVPDTDSDGLDDNAEKQWG
ncbi:hypothetical protein HQ585_13105, partial [candidate division KSB1 bacterium]|nr:hypothetical protein [candidate division KSB1 bacterium]